MTKYTLTPHGAVNKTLLVLCIMLGWQSTASLQTYTLAPQPYLTITDSSNNPVTSGCIWTYVAGTTTEVATYSNSSGTLNANPIIADSAGRFTVYLSPGSSYKFTYENTPCSASSHGSVIKTQDNIPAVPVSGLVVDVAVTAGATLAAGDVTYVSDGSGSLNAGQAYQADADNTYSSTTAVTIGLATAAISSTASGTIRTTGRVTGLTGLSAGEIYYVSATAGALTATPPTNARCVGKADSTTSLILPCDVGDVRLPDSDGTHSVVFRTSSDLTADRILTVVPGDAARTVTLSGNPTLNDWFDQSVKTTGTAPSFNAFRPPQGRCTLTTATPVTTSDVPAATTLYYALYGGNQITLYDGSARWVQMSFTELSIAVPASTNQMYDVFVDYTAGTPALEAVAWTNDTTRATELALQNGVYVQTADTDSLYVCSFRTTGVSGQTEDSLAKRFVWNYYNRRIRPMRVLEATDTWTYHTSTIRQANGSAANQLAFVVGVAEVPLKAMVQVSVNNGASNQIVQIGIGLDTTSAFTSGGLRPKVETQAANIDVPLVATLETFPAAGYHFASWNEYGGGSATTTWNGDNGDATLYQSGIVGSIEG